MPPGVDAVYLATYRVSRPPPIMHLTLITRETALAAAFREYFLPSYDVLHLDPASVGTGLGARVVDGVRSSAAVVVVCEGPYVRVLTHLHEVLGGTEAPLIALCPSPHEQEAQALLAGAAAVLRMPLAPMVLMAQVENCRRKIQRARARAHVTEEMAAAWNGAPKSSSVSSRRER